MILKLAELFFNILFVFAEDPVVQLKFGQVVGSVTEVNGVVVKKFLGLPFAKPPIGELRLKKPVPYDGKWTEPLVAKNWGNICTQYVIDVGINYTDPTRMSEDCLNLNVWTTHSLTKQSSQEELKPVLVYIHGGGFYIGSSAIPLHDATNLAATGDLVVVTLNYRLGPLGFMYGNDEDVPPNVGLWDQLLALEWIQDNIEFFGGNPRQVTISGTSAGSMSVTTHLLSPLSTHLYDKAMAFSGVANDHLAVITKELAIRRASALAAVVGCRKENSISLLTTNEVQCLREVDAVKLANSQVDPRVVFIEGRLDPWPFRPVFGDAFLPTSPVKALKEGSHKINSSILIGTTVNEGSCFEFLRGMFRPTETPKSKNDFIQAVNSLFDDKELGCHRLPEEVVKSVYFANGNDDDLVNARKAMLNLYGDVTFDCPTNLFAEYLSKSNHVYQYLFAVQSTLPSPMLKEGDERPTHGEDVQFQFNVGLSDPKDLALSSQWMSFLIKFVKGEEMPVPKHSFTALGRPIAPYYVFRGNDNNEIGTGYKHYPCSFWRDALTEQLAL